jgi:hypothetical protein
MGNDVMTRDQEAKAFAAAAQEESGGGMGTLLKFDKGEYFIGNDPVTLGTEFVAHISQWARGWVKFVDSKPAEQRIGLVREGFKVAEREELGDLDETKWEKDATGKPRSPWSEQSYLPLENVATSEVLVFVSGSAGGRKAIARLGKTYAINRHCGQPIIKLSVSSYRHKEFGKSFTPEFKIIGWTERANKQASVPASTNNYSEIDPPFDDSIDM